MKNKRIIAVIVLILIIVLGFIIYKNVSIKNQEDEYQDYIPEEEISDEQMRQTKIILYFVNNETGELETEIKVVDANTLIKNPEKQIMELLIKGPQSSNLKKLIPDGTILHDIKIENSCAIINVSNEFLNYQNEEEKLKIINSIVNTLTNLKEIESDAILDFIKKGGKIALFTDANVTKMDMPNFQKVLDEYGVSISEGVLLEQDSSKMLSGAPSAILVTVEAGTSVTENINMLTSACFINSGKIILKDSETMEKLGVEVETLASTSSQAFYRSDLSIESTSKQEGDEQGVATVGALLTKKIDDDTSSKLIVYSNNMFVTSMQISLNNQYYLYAYELYNNEDLALNSIAYLTGREDTIMLRKDTETTSYTVTEQQQVIILTIIFSVPVVIIIIGLVVWQVRRRKK